jgi:hypothetical protein
VHARDEVHTCATPRLFKEISLIRIRVHVLYKRAEISANKMIRAIAVSVSYREHEKAENPGSISVSATKFFWLYALAGLDRKYGSRSCHPQFLSMLPIDAGD